MAHRIKLTKTIIERLDFEKEGQWVTDTEVPQLVVRLSRTSKRYVARWTSPTDGKRRQEAIADTTAISVSEARDRARKLVAGDRPHAVETLGDVFDVWDKQYSSERSAAHAEEFRRSWRKHIEPDWGRTKLSRITHEGLQQWYHQKRREYPVTPTGQTKDATYSAATVNRWISYISRLLTIARASSWMIANPAEKLEKSTPNRRVDIFTLDDIKHLGDALTANHARFPIGVDLVRFLLLFPCRGKEAREMRWADLDLKEGTWTIPAPQYKSRKAKVFPLGPLQVQHLKSLPRRSQTYVFPMVTDSSRPVSKSHQRNAWEASRPKALGIHALRKTIATLLLNDNVPLEAISLILGHSSTLVTQQAYAHLHPNEARKHLNRWAAILMDDVERSDDDIDAVLLAQRARAIQEQSA